MKKEKNLNFYLIKHFNISKVGIAIIVLLSIITKSITLISSILFGILFDEAPHGFNAIKKPLIGVLILIASDAFLTSLTSYVTEFIRENTNKKVRGKFAELLNKLNITTMLKQKSGDLISRIQNDLDCTEQFAFSLIPEVIYSIVLFFVSIIYSLHINSLLTVVCILVVPVAIMCSVAVSNPLQSITEKERAAEGDVNTLSEDIFSNIESVKSYNLEKSMIQMYLSKLKNLTAWKKKITITQVKMSIIENVGGNLPFLTMFLFGGYLAIEGKFTFGKLMSFAIAFTYITAPLISMPNWISQYKSLSGKAKRIKDIFDLPAEKFLESDTKNIKEYKNAVDFVNVNFDYNNNKVLNDVSFKIKKGEYVAIIGVSGSGKSTILKMITGLLMPQNGIVRVFDKSVDTWNLIDLRKKVSVVTQDIFLFPDTIRKNILVGNPMATEKELIWACKKSDLLDFIESLPNGFDTIVGEKGNFLSGGQKQRIAIARALLKNSEILIFDEATSALDVKTENNFRSSLISLAGEKTIIVVTHRLSMLKDADKIYCVNQGKILCCDDYSSLTNNKENYNKLYNIN